MKKISPIDWLPGLGELELWRKARVATLAAALGVADCP